jgi:uncharacterized protein (TIGR03085 family)
MTTAPESRDLREVYANRASARTGPAISRVERASLVDTFLRVGPSAATLCAGWDAHHLAAHLVLREGSLLTPLRAASKHSDEAVADVAARNEFEYLVEQVRTGPPQLSLFRIPGAESRFNGLEYVIHHEDVRRAQPDWQRRDLPTWAQTQVWKPLCMFGKAVTRQAPVAVTLCRSDTGETSTARRGDRPVVVRGLPLELALFINGRARVADVELDGEADAIERLRETRLGY